MKDVAVPFGEFTLDEVVGEGTYGIVYKGVWRGGAVAVKMIRPNVLLGMGFNEIELFKQEAYLMSRLRHPNIVLIMGISMRNIDAIKPLARASSRDSRRDSEEEDGRPSTVESLYILSEYMDRGSLADIMMVVREEELAQSTSRGVSSTSSSSSSMLGWGYEMVLACALQAARGMTYLHSYSPPICHRDLKSSNLVVDDHWVVKVTDFGTSRMLPSGEGVVNKGLYTSGSGKVSAMNSPAGSPNLEGNFFPRESMLGACMTSNIGTTAWAAPEMLTAAADTSYSLKIDVYSFGIVLWELWERKVPFQEFSSSFDMMDAIRQGKRPEMSPSAPPFLKDLYLRCIDGTPSRRPKFAVIVKELKDELSKQRVETDRRAGHSDSTSSISFPWLGRGNSIDWINNNANGNGHGTPSTSRAISNNSSGRHVSRDVGAETSNIASALQPPPPGRKYSIVSNVLASPVLGPLFSKGGVNESELDSFDSLDHPEGSSPTRHSFS